LSIVFFDLFFHEGLRASSGAWTVTHPTARPRLATGREDGGGRRCRLCLALLSEWISGEPGCWRGSCFEISNGDYW